MQRHTFTRAFKFTSFLALMFIIALLTGTLYAAPKVGPVTPENSIIGQNANDRIGSGGVYHLPSGNIVISSPYWSESRGAVTCLTPEQYKIGGIVVSPANSLVGSTPNDQVGNVIMLLSNGNYVVRSEYWNNGAAIFAGAATWVNGSTCIPHNEALSGAAVSSTNSLVGTMTNDNVGSMVTVLPNGNYVVRSAFWHNGIGAATWGNGLTGIAGVITDSNSLVGSYHEDNVGSGIEILTNSNYVLVNFKWRNGTEYFAGAVTWADGTKGVVGVVSEANSLVGSNANDAIGRVVPLNNGNYLVGAIYWDNGDIENAGMVAWGNGTTGTVGVISPSNALVGSKYNDRVGHGAIMPLLNGNYVISSPNWDNGTVSNAGAVTWGDGTVGISGPIDATNSLVGSLNNAEVGNKGIIELKNGNYVVPSPQWDNYPHSNVGAVTWGNGTSGVVGAVNATNSLIGSHANDTVGSAGVTALDNGSYVVGSPAWDSGGTSNVGAVTWGNGTSGVVGAVNAANSLVGSNANDTVGSAGVTALENGNYVVTSPVWDNGTTIDAGAVTWGNGEVGTIGQISAGNSLVGLSDSDQVGSGGITPLSNGNYVISSPYWDHAGIVNAGAVTWANGSTSVTGSVSAANSLVGSSSDDLVGSPFGYQNSISSITALSNGNYVVVSPGWDNNSLLNAGAVTWGSGISGLVGTITPANSLISASAETYAGYGGVTSLNNGNYVVTSVYAEGGGVDAVSVDTWTNGAVGAFGILNTANSLVGAARYNLESGFYYERTIRILDDGDYIISSPNWPPGSSEDFGAVILGSGSQGINGSVSAANALVGTMLSDSVGDRGTSVLPDGSFFVISPSWDNGATQDVGAVTWSEGTPLHPNSAPILAEIGDKTVDEGDTLTFEVNASDLDAPPQTLTFSIDGAPEDASFDTSTGEFSWTAGEEDGGQAFNVTVTVTDDGEPALNDSEDFTIIVNEVNNAPVLAEIGNKTVDVGATVTFDAEATDADDPAQTLTFSITGAPEDASFDTETGAFSWTAGEADGGQIFNVTVTVTDNGEPTLSDSEAFTITVKGMNNAPVLAEISDYTVDVGATVTFDAEATDSDEPVQTLTFSIAGAPEDASFDTSTGEFSWTAGEDDGGQVFNVTVTVTDDGEPALSDSEDFTITVNQVIVETNYLPNASFENPGTTNKTVAGWNGVGLTTNDKRICDTDTKTYAHDGECAFRFQFNGASQPTRTLQRNLNVANFAKNDVVQLRGMVKANNLTAGARLIVKVVYNNGKTEAVGVKLLPGNYNYAPRTVQITLKRPVKKITVQIKAGSAKGIFFVDDMAVVKITAPLTIDDGATGSGLRGLD